MTLLQITPVPTQQPDIIVQVLTTLLSNADKISIGLIVALVIVLFFFLLRYLGKKDEQNINLNQSLISLASDNNEAGKTMAETSESIKDGALALKDGAHSLAESSKLLVDVVRDANTNLLIVKDMLTAGFSGIAPAVRLAVREEIAAIVAEQNERSGIVVESLFSQIRELKQFFSEYSSRRTGLFMLDADRKVLFVSEEVIDIFELTREDLTGVTSSVILGKLSLIFPDGRLVRDDETPSAIVKLTKKESMPIIVGFYSKSTKFWVWLQMTGIPYFDEQQELSRIIVNVSELGTIIMDRQPLDQ